MPYSVGTYRGEGRSRHAVFCQITNVWYFPRSYGLRAATSLCRAMNRKERERG